MTSIAPVPAFVEVEGRNKNDRIIQSIIKAITAQKPSRIKNLESDLLRLEDLYGIAYNAVLTKKEDSLDDEVTLILQPRKRQKEKITLGINNHGSRFVGPYRGSLTFEHSLLDYHKTTLTGVTGLPNRDELILGSLYHRLQITPSTELNFLLSKSRSKPGFTLRRSDVESSSFSWGAGIQWSLIRQRDKNFKVFARFDALNSKTDTFSTALTRDKIRTLRFGGSYDFRDKFLGLNVVSLSLSQGVDGFGASDANNPFSSRSDAKPDFTKLEVGYNRQDFISKSLLFNLDLKGQLSPDGLYSSEEFGFGGINAGRAYDFSEITGDQGFSALAEIQYTGLDRFYNYQVHPFVFYDFGKVWNKGDAAIKNISASSAGVGARVYGDNGLNFDASLAFPLTKSIDNPLYGNGKNPVLRFGMTYQF